MIFKQTLIEKLGLENIPSKERVSILEKVADIVLDRTLLKLTKELSTEEAKQINELLENDKQDEVAVILYQKFPNINDIFDEQIDIIKAELIKEYGK